MNHLLNIPMLKLPIKKGSAITKESLYNFLRKMEKQGMPKKALTARDYEHHVMLRIKDAKHN